LFSLYEHSLVFTEAFLFFWNRAAPSPATLRFGFPVMFFLFSRVPPQAFCQPMIAPLQRLNSFAFRSCPLFPPFSGVILVSALFRSLVGFIRILSCHFLIIDDDSPSLSLIFFVFLYDTQPPYSTWILASALFFYPPPVEPGDLSFVYVYVCDCVLPFLFLTFSPPLVRFAVTLAVMFRGFFFHSRPAAGRLSKPPTLFFSVQ